MVRNVEVGLVKGTDKIDAESPLVVVKLSVIKMKAILYTCRQCKENVVVRGN